MTVVYKRKKILVIKNRAIGDTVLLTGTLRALKKAYPTHEIHVMAKAPAGQLLIGLPFVDRVISIYEPKSKFDRIAYWLRTLMRLRNHKFDLVLNFHASLKTSFISKALRTQKVVTNHHSLKGWNWFSDVSVPGRKTVKSNIDRDLDILRALVPHIKSANPNSFCNFDVSECMPEIFISNEEKKQAKLLLNAKGVSFENEEPKKTILFWGIGASRETKRWTAKHFAELALQVHQNLGAQILITSVDTDKTWLEDFFKFTSKYASLHENILHFHEVHLKQAANLMSYCKVFVGNDSGLKHIAVALGLPTLTFFGPEDPLEWHPYPQNRHPLLFIQNLKCRTELGKHWCPIEKCEKHGHRCMTELTVSMAYEKLLPLL